MEYTVGPRLLIAELQRRLLGHDSGTGNPPWHHDRSLAVSVVQDHSVTHRRSRSLLRLTGGGSTRERPTGGPSGGECDSRASRRYALLEENDERRDVPDRDVAFDPRIGLAIEQQGGAIGRAIPARRADSSY